MTLDHSQDASAKRAALLARARRNGTVRPPIPAAAPDTRSTWHEREADARQRRAALLARATAHAAFAPSRVETLTIAPPSDGAPQDGARLTRPRPAGPVTPDYQRRAIVRPHRDAAPFGPSGAAHDRPLPAGVRLPDACDPPPADKWGHAVPRSHVVPTADGGYAVSLREFWPSAGLRTRRVPLLATDGTPVRVTAEQREARHTTLAIRSDFLATRRALALAESVTFNLIATNDPWRAAPCHFASGAPVVLAGAILMAPVPTPAILDSLLDDGAALAGRLVTLDRASDAARKRRDRTATTVQAAARRVRDSEARARRRASETQEQREARLTAQRERSARNREAKRASA